MDEPDRRILGPVTTRSLPGEASVSVVIVTHQSEAFIGRVLDLLVADDDGPDEIIVVDNASTDETRRIVDRSDVRLVALEDNTGFAGGCHAGVDAANGDIIVFAGHDTVPRPGWIPPLVAALDDLEVGAAMATIEDSDNPEVFNTSGGHLTYYGIAWVSDLGDPIPNTEAALVDVAFPSGAAMAIRREVWDRFDGFRRSLFMYHEDTDLGWRLRLAGLRVVRVPESRVGHEYDFSRTPTKMYWLERNRRILLATNYRMRAWADTWRSRGLWQPDRKATANLRTVGDAEMLETMDWSVSNIRQVDTPRGSEIAGRFFKLYLRGVLPLVRWFDRRAGFIS